MDVINKSICTGCLACVKICPVHAINIVTDDTGFKYPQINPELCIKCGKCHNSCITNNREINKNKEPIKVLGVKIKDNEERLKSRSGGIFSKLSNHILSQNGIVYGCVLGNDLEVHHSRAGNEVEAQRFKGSKYVKSNLKNVYKEVEQDLQDDKKVLFSGTPCEVAGLYTSLNNISKDNLYTCDIICHGTPSPLIYQEFINFMEGVENEKIKHINFRDKQFGWNSHTETLEFETKKVSTEYYKELFYSHYVLRPSCFNCQFANMDRISDITIGDFWGIDEENKEFNDNKGVSLVIVNTKKGEKLIQEILDDIHFITIDTKSQNYLQANLQKPSEAPENINQFWEEYKNYGFNYIIEKYGKYPKKE